MGIFQGLLGLEDGVNIGERTAGGFWRRAEEVTRRISGSVIICHNWYKNDKTRFSFPEFQQED